MAKTYNKTKPGEVSVDEYLATLTQQQREDALELISLFTSVTKTEPVMWGASMIGFGSYHYKYDSGREGDSLASGFSMRKSGPTLYIMPGYSNYQQILSKLGPHKLGKACVYLKSLQDTNIDALKDLIQTGLKDLMKIYPVNMK